MLFNNISFNAMQSGLDALWLKQRVISDNISNYETPGYKTKSVEFEDVLRAAGKDKNGNRKYMFKATVNTQDNTTIRPDGNNVSLEKENIELWRAYSQYSYLSKKITDDFKNMRYVINQALK